MKINNKILILGLVFVLSTVFFWAAINKMLIPSRAAGEKKLTVFIFEQKIECNASSTCSASIYASSDQGAGISGVTGILNYPETLSFVSAGAGVLETELAVKDDPASRTVKFSYVSLKADSELQSGGPHKIATLTFKPNVQTGAGNLSLAVGSLWQAVGSVPFIVESDTKAVSVSISSSAPQGGSCNVAGDCDCDDKVNLLDFELMRPGLTGEGAPKCDVDNNGGYLDKRDYDSWRGNAFPGRN